MNSEFVWAGESCSIIYCFLWSAKSEYIAFFYCKNQIWLLCCWVRGVGVVFFLESKKVLIIVGANFSSQRGHLTYHIFGNLIRDPQAHTYRNSTAICLEVIWRSSWEVGWGNHLSRSCRSSIDVVQTHWSLSSDLASFENRSDGRCACTRRRTFIRSDTVLGRIQRLHFPLSDSAVD